MPPPELDCVGLRVTSAEMTSSKFWLTLKVITSQVSVACHQRR